MSPFVQADDNVIIPFKGRYLNPERPLQLYRNLTKKGVWYSIRQGNQVVAHTTAICLNSCTFHVSEATRQRILRNKKKEFHAYIEGYCTGSVMGTTAKRNDLPAKIQYNPFKDTFFSCKNLTPKPFHVKGASGVICNGEGVRGAYLF